MRLRLINHTQLLKSFSNKHFQVQGAQHYEVSQMTVVDNPLQYGRAKVLESSEVTH